MLVMFLVFVLALCEHAQWRIKIQFALTANNKLIHWTQKEAVSAMNFLSQASFKTNSFILL